MNNQSNYNEIVFAYSKSDITNPKSFNKGVTLGMLYNIITNDKPVNYDKIGEITINGLNNNIDVKKIKKDIAPYKMKLPFALFSGYQSNGHDNKNLIYNGCIQIDIDIKEKDGDVKAQMVKEQLSKLPYIALAAISPSQVGVKALIFTDNFDIEKHLTVSSLVINEVAKEINLDVKYFDNLGASQPVFVPFDKECYVNYNYAVVDSADLLKDVEKSSKTTKKYTNKTINKVAQDTQKTILNDEDKDLALNISWNYASKLKGKEFTTPFIQSFIGCTIKFGVSAEDSMNYILTKVDKSELYQKRTNTINDMYSRYSYNFATAKIEHDIEEVTFNNNSNIQYTIKSKLSELNIDLSVNSFIKAPTGSGKSYYVSNIIQDKRVMVVPTQSLVLQFAKEYNATPFYQDAKTINNDNFIVTTYSSLKNLSTKINTKEYVLFVDEAHNFTASANAFFLLNEMNEVLQLLPSFKMYHLLSATPLFNNEPLINSLRLIDIKLEKQLIKKQIIKMSAVDTLKAIKTIADDCFSQNIQFIVLSNNTNEEGRLGKIQSVLSHLNIATINSKTKTTNDYYNIAIDGDMTNCDGFITTTVIKEGNSITKHSSEVTVIVDGAFHPAELEQIAARFRNATKVNLVIIKSDKAKTSYIPFNITDELNNINDVVVSLENVRKAMEKSSLIYNELNTLSTLEQNYFRKDDNGKLVVDNLHISNRIFEIEKKVANADLRYMITYLRKMGWEYDSNNDSYSSATVLDSTEKEKVKVDIETKKQLNTTKIEAVYNDILQHDFEHNSSILEQLKSDSKSDSKEVEIRSLVNYIYNNYECNNDINDVVETIRIYKTKQSKSLIYSNTNIRKIRENIDLNNPLHKFVKEVYDTFKIGNRYNTDDMYDMFINCLKNNNLYNKDAHGTKNKITTIIKSFFVIDRKTVRNGENFTDAYEFLSQDIVPNNMIKNKELNIKTINTANIITILNNLEV